MILRIKIVNHHFLKWRTPPKYAVLRRAREAYYLVVFCPFRITYSFLQAHKTFKLVKKENGPPRKVMRPVLSFLECIAKRKVYSYTLFSKAKVRKFQLPTTNCLYAHIEFS